MMDMISMDEFDDVPTLVATMTPCQTYEAMVQEQTLSYPNVAYVSEDWDNLVGLLLDFVTEHKLKDQQREFIMARVRHCQQYINEFRSLTGRPLVQYSY